MIAGGGQQETSSSERLSLSDQTLQEREVMNSGIEIPSFQERFEHYYNLDDDPMFYKREGWHDYVNLKLGLSFKHPVFISRVEVLNVGELTCVQLRKDTDVGNTNIIGEFCHSV